MFVPLVENGYTQGEVARLVAEEYLSDLKDAGVDTLILGCTHYPLLSNTIRAVMGDSVNLIDAGAQTACYARDRLSESGLLSSKSQGSCRYYVSDGIEGFTDLAELFLKQKIEGSVHQIDIETY
jgi:glutamate racemase